MSSLTNDVNNIIKYFKSENIPYAIGGGHAIKLLCDKYSVVCPFDVNNIDIFYMSNTPIPTKKIGNATRKEDSLRTTITYITPEWVDINLTMKRNHYMNIIQYKGMNIMHPINLISYYNDEFELDEIQEYKLFILNSILEIIKSEPKLVLSNTNFLTTEKNTVIVPQSRATNAFYQRLQSISE
jgi:hypothetical protein